MRRERYIAEIGLRRRRFRTLYVLTWILLLSVLVVAAGEFLILRNPLFIVRSIDVKGLTYIPQDRVQSLLLARVLDESYWKHILGLRNILVWPDYLTDEDLKLLPEASAVLIHKDYWLRKITIEVKERAHQSIWCFKGGAVASCYWFDAAGLITPTPASEGSLVLTVNDYTRSGMNPGETLLAPELLPNLLTVFEAIKGMDVNVKEIRLENLALQEVRVPTWNGPDLLFSLRFPATNTPAAWKVLQTKTSISKLKEVDFRVENRIYYK